MQQIIPAGTIVSAPGSVGSPSVFQFADIGDPNSRSDPQGLLAGCQLGSTFQRIDGTSATTFFYVKTAQPAANAPTGTWTPK